MLGLSTVPLRPTLLNPRPVPELGFSTCRFLSCLPALRSRLLLMFRVSLTTPLHSPVVVPLLPTLSKPLSRNLPLRLKLSDVAPTATAMMSVLPGRRLVGKQKPLFRSVSLAGQHPRTLPHPERRRALSICERTRRRLELTRVPVVRARDCLSAAFDKCHEVGRNNANQIWKHFTASSIHGSLAKL